MIDDAIGDAVGEIAGAVIQHTGGLVVDVVTAGIFSASTARFFHGVGRRAIAAATFGTVRIPSSLRIVPRGAHARPRRSDWLALWAGVAIWIALFAAICIPLGIMLWG